jgi:hypothetical protein
MFVVSVRRLSVPVRRVSVLVRRSGGSDYQGFEKNRVITDLFAGRNKFYDEVNKEAG